MGFNMRNVVTMVVILWTHSSNFAWSGELPGSAVEHSFLFHDVNILFNTVSPYEFNKCSNLDLHIMHDTSNT